MIKTRKNLTGQVFGRWKVLKQDEEDYKAPCGTKESKWICECQCEKKIIKSVRRSSLISGESQSCGCLQKEKAALIGERSKKYNKYDLTGEYGIGWTTNTNEEFYFDLEDYDKIKDYCWYDDTHGYIKTSSIGEKGVAFHKLIVPYSIVDHKNRNRKDNRKENLRDATISLNNYNSSKSKNNKSGFIGVSYSNERSKWVAQITYNYKSIPLGRYVNKEDAIKIRLQAEYDIFGVKWAPQRHLFEQYNIPDSNLHKIIYNKLENHGKLDCLKQQE